MNRATVILAVVAWAGVASHASADRTRDLLPAYQEMFHEAVDVVLPCVVRIQTIGGAQPRFATDNDDDAPQPPPEDDGSPPEKPQERENLPFRDDLGANFMVADGPTAGIIYESDGWILTSSFNFVREPAHITVELNDGRRFVAELVARDRVRKLAILKIDATDLPTPEWVPDDQIEVGQTALAVGYGFGGESPSVTAGVVSALNRMMGNATQTDAKLSPANYGGPLIDLKGHILGICVPMAQRPGDLAGIEFYDAGIGFAVPYHRVREIAADLQRGISFHRGWLGVSISRGTCTIRAVADPSPVRSLGIRSGDIIAFANGRELRNITNLRQAIYMVPAGETVTIIIRRGRLEFGYEVVLASNEELGKLEVDDPLPDPENPFTIPNKERWPR